MPLSAGAPVRSSTTREADTIPSADGPAIAHGMVTRARSRAALCSMTHDSFLGGHMQAPQVSTVAPGHTPTVSRRYFLRGTVALAAASLAMPPLSHRVRAQVRLTGYPFTLGVASGCPQPDSVVLWTRLAPEPLAGGGMEPGRVEVHW